MECGYMHGSDQCDQYDHPHVALQFNSFSQDGHNFIRLYLIFLISSFYILYSSTRPYITIHNIVRTLSGNWSSLQKA